MEIFHVKPTICRVNSCQELIQQLHIDEHDFILASKASYLTYFQRFDLAAKVVFKSDYGSGEPTDLMCQAVMEEVRKGSYQRIIAIGGGAVIDIAKVLAVAETESIDELYENAPALKKTRCLVVVPTTCGTGSEVTNISILSRTRLNTKVGLVSDQLFPDYAVLLPELLTDLPFSVFATSSLDALVHSVESALSPKANEMTRLFSYRALNMILQGYSAICRQGKRARIPLLGDFLLASTYAGIAFSNAGCATVHALSYPLGTTHHVPHGESNYAIFSGVLRKYNQRNPRGELLVLQKAIADILGCSPEQAFSQLEVLLSGILTRTPLHQYGVTREELSSFTDSVLENQQRLLANSFVPISREDILDIYQNLY